MPTIVRKRGPTKGSIVVLYPYGLGHYIDREFLGFVPGYDTIFVTPVPGLAFTPGVPIQEVQAEYRILWPTRFGLTIAGTYIRNLENILRRIEPAVVVTYELHSSLSAIARRHRSSFGYCHAILCYETGSPSTSCWGRFPLSRALAAESLREADLIIAHTERARASILDFGANPVKVRRIYPGVYVSPRHQAAYSTHADDSLRIGYLGGLRENKGIRTLIEGITQFNKLHAGTSVEFHIAGIGPFAVSVQRLSEKFSNVRFFGWMPSESKLSFLRNLDLLVYPSSETRLAGYLRWEEQSATSALEAMAEGVPVLGSTSGALPEIIDGAGDVFALNSASDFANKLWQIVDSRQRLRLLSDLAWKRASENFDNKQSGSLFAIALAQTIR